MFEYLFEALSNALQAMSLKQAQRSQKSEVISLIRKALRNTKYHIEHTRVGEFDDTASTILADQWSEAAKAIRPFHPRTARTFEEKSDYWTNPNGFHMDLQNENRRFDDLFRIEAVEKTLKGLERQWGF